LRLAELFTENISRNNGENRRTSNFGHVVSQKKRGQRLVKLIENEHNTLGSFISVICKCLYLYLVDRRKRAFSRRKISATANANKKYDP
jgi:hypothetical protein